MNNINSECRLVLSRVYLSPLHTQQHPVVMDWVLA